MVTFYPQIEWNNLPFHITRWSNYKKLYLLKFTLNYKAIGKYLFLVILELMPKYKGKK